MSMCEIKESNRSGYRDIERIFIPLHGEIDEHICVSASILRYSFDFVADDEVGAFVLVDTQVTLIEILASVPLLECEDEMVFVLIGSKKILYTRKILPLDTLLSSESGLGDLSAWRSSAISDEDELRTSSSISRPKECSDIMEGADIFED